MGGLKGSVVLGVWMEPVSEMLCTVRDSVRGCCDAVILPDMHLNIRNLQPLP